MPQGREIVRVFSHDEARSKRKFDREIEKILQPSSA
jgi:hypothetical protein